MSEFNAQEIIDNHGGKCKTRDGRDAVIYEIVGDGYYAAMGAILNKGEEDGPVAAQWQRDTGKVFSLTSCCDLIMPRTVVAEWWTATVNGKWWANFSELSSAQGEVSSAPAKLFHTTVYSDDTVESEVVS